MEQNNNMRTFVNKIGCSMSFENGISEEEINKRLSFMGNIENWREIKNGNQQKRKKKNIKENERRFN